MTIKLVPPVSAKEEARQSVIKLLRKTLEEAEAGQLQSVVMIIESVDGTWADRASETIKFSEAIGRLEITKQEWIAQYLKKNDQ